MTRRGFGDDPDEAALSKQGSKRVVNNTADRWFTWILPAQSDIKTQNSINTKKKVSRLFPTISRSRTVLAKRNTRVIHEDVYLRAITNERVCKSRNRCEFGEVHKGKFCILETSSLLYG